MVPSREPTGVLVLRVWLEPDDQPCLRARVTAATGLYGNGTRSEVFAGVDPVLSFLEQWLRAFEDSAPGSQAG